MTRFTALFLAAALTAPGLVVADGGTPVPGTAGPAAVTIVEHKGAWADLTGVGPGGEIADAGSFYLIRGTLRDDSGRAIGYVRLSYELVDASGETVFREYRYNRSAEDLRDEAFESGAKPLREMNVEPLPVSAVDSFRMFFSGTRFHRLRATASMSDSQTRRRPGWPLGPGAKGPGGGALSGAPRPSPGEVGRADRERLHSAPPGNRRRIGRCWHLMSPIPRIAIGLVLAISLSASTGLVEARDGGISARSFLDTGGVED